MKTMIRLNPTDYGTHITWWDGPARSHIRSDCHKCKMSPCISHVAPIVEYIGMRHLMAIGMDCECGEVTVAATERKGVCWCHCEACAPSPPSDPFLDAHEIKIEDCGFCRNGRVLPCVCAAGWAVPVWAIFECCASCQSEPISCEVCAGLGYHELVANNAD